MRLTPYLATILGCTYFFLRAYKTLFRAWQLLSPAIFISVNKHKKSPATNRATHRSKTITKINQ